MHRPLVSAIVCLSASLACKPQTDDAQDQVSPAGEPAPGRARVELPVGALVVLDDQTDLLASATATGPRFVLQPMSTRGQGRVVEVRSHTGDLIEVRTLGHDRPVTCADRFGFDARYQLSFFVDRGSLREVLAEPKLVEFADGTKLEFVAGVPVSRADALAELRVDGLELLAPVAASELSLWFWPADTRSHSGPPTLVFTTFSEPGIELRYGDHSVVAGTAPFRVAHKREATPDGERLTFTSTCGRFELRAAAEDLAPDNPNVHVIPRAEDATPLLSRSFTTGDPGLLGLPRSDGSKPPLPCEPEGWLAPAGAALTWAGFGGPAGVVLRDHELPYNARSVEDSVCFELLELDLCIDLTKLERVGDPGCGHAGFGGRGKRGPRVREARAWFSEGLEPDEVRGVVRAHLGDVRGCYEYQVLGAFNLEGRVAIAFEIDAEGEVVRAKLRESTLKDRDVEACIVAAVERWTFPAPAGGESVHVLYPLNLRPG